MTAAELLGPTLPRSEREVRAAMIMTLFGAFGRGGTSGPLGNDTDSELLQALRSWADVILVSAATVRAEDYGPSETPLAVLTRSFDLDPDLGIFRGTPPLILAPEHLLDDDSVAHARNQLESTGATIVGIGGGSAPEAVATLHARGFHRIACEGGPSVYADMIANDQLDVVHLTVEPTAAHTDGPWGLDALTEGPNFFARFALEHTHATADSTLFLRYRNMRD